MTIVGRLRCLTAGGQIKCLFTELYVCEGIHPPSYISPIVLEAGRALARSLLAGYILPSSGRGRLQKYLRG